MSTIGKRSVFRACRLLAEKHGRLAFWTVTLPPEALEAVAQADAVPWLTEALLRRLRRLLRSRGMPDLIVGVVEIQPKRLRETGIPVPHWHVVYEASRRRWRDWAIDKEELRALVVDLLGELGVSGFWPGACSKVEAVRKDPGSYLAAYMKKRGINPEAFEGTEWEALIPRQWWLWSRSMRRWTMLHVFPLRRDFVLWVWDNRHQLAEREAIGLRKLRIPDPRAPDAWEIDWLSAGHLAQLLALWTEDAWDADWFPETVDNWRR